MRIVVVGAGEVGSYVSELLSKEGSDVAVIEKDPARLAAVEKRHDVLGVLGDGTHPETLRRAGIEQADLLVAVTQFDAVNMVSCLVAKEIAKPRTIARIESAGLRGPDMAGIHAAARADLVIDPDEATAQEIIGLLAYPGATEIAFLGNGAIIMIGATLSADAPFVGQTLAEIGEEHGPDWDFIVGTITRGSDSIVPRKDHRLEAGDEVRVLCKRRARKLVTELLGLHRGSHRRVMLLGGGRTAEILARNLIGRGSEVTLVERQPKRCEELARELEGVLILEGDITDVELLESEDVGSQHAVIALTGEDDANVLACLFAKSMGARETIAVLHRLELRGLLHEVGIDAAISPRTASANAVLRQVHGGITQVTTFLESDIEVFELEVDPASKANGAIVAELALPKGTLIAAIIRGGKASIGRKWSEFRPLDHVVVVTRAEKVQEIREIFSRA